MSQIVHLSPGAVFVGSSIATLRQEVNRAAGRTNLKEGPQDPMTTELVGIYGEIGFAQWANVMPDLSIHLRAGGHDCMYRGWSVDVKATRRKAAPIWRTYMRESKQSMLYVFVQVEYAEVEICGWLWGSEVPASGVVTRDDVCPAVELTNLDWRE